MSNINLHDISDLDDIKLLVNTFYHKAKYDKTLAPFFNTRIGDNWPQHLEKMYRYWQTFLLDQPTYFEPPFTPHEKMQLSPVYFEKWLELFQSVVDALFVGKRAEVAKQHGKRMAEMFELKIRYPNNL